MTTGRVIPGPVSPSAREAKRLARRIHRAAAQRGPIARSWQRPSSDSASRSAIRSSRIALPARPATGLTDTSSACQIAQGIWALSEIPASPRILATPGCPARTLPHSRAAIPWRPGVVSRIAPSTCLNALPRPNASPGIARVTRRRASRTSASAGAPLERKAAGPRHPRSDPAPPHSSGVRLINKFNGDHATFNRAAALAHRFASAYSKRVHAASAPWAASQPT